MGMGLIWRACGDGEGFWAMDGLYRKGPFEGDDPDIAVAEAVTAAVAGQRSGAVAFGTTDDQVDILRVSGGKLVELMKYFGLVMLDEPAHQLGLDGLALGDGEGGAAGSPPGGDAVVADALGAGVEEVAGVCGEVELSAGAAGPGSEQGESVFGLGQLLLEVG